MTAPLVPWVVGRKRALANAIALVVLEFQGKDPRRVSHHEMKKLVAAAEMHVDDMVRRRVLASFDHEWRGSDEVEP